MITAWLKPPGYDLEFLQVVDVSKIVRVSQIVGAKDTLKGSGSRHSW